MPAVDKTTFFSRLNQNEIKKIKDIAINKSYKKGEYIFYEGDPGNQFFMIIKGKVKLVKMIANGDEHILSIFTKNDIIAEVVAFDHGNYPASAVALEETQLAVFANNSIEELIEKNPQIGLKLLKEMSARLRRSQQVIRDLALKDSPGKMIGILKVLAKKHGKKKGNKIEIDLPLTQQEIANMIGTSRETVSRIFRKFEEDGILKTSRNKIVILDINEFN